MENRARAIEQIVQRDYCDEGIDAADLAYEELRHDAARSDKEIARIVAQKILQA